MGDSISRLLRDAGSFLWHAVWNGALGVYGVIVGAWGLISGLYPCLRGPEDFIGPLLIGALIIGSFMAYRKVKQEELWDHNALQVEDSHFAEWTKDPKNFRHGLLLEIKATKVIPSPMRIRLWLSAKPTFIKAEIQATKPKRPRFVELDGKTGFECKVRGARVYLKFLSPPLTVSDRLLIISIHSRSPLSYRSVAAYRYKD